MKRLTHARLFGLSLVAALAGCADAADKIAAPREISSEIRTPDSGSSVATERAALEEIGRLVAASLGDKGMRHQLKKHLRAAPFKEHKLELRAYLRGPDGKQLLTKLGGEKKSDAILTLLNQVRPLELYMPERKQRESWVGDADVLVAIQLEESDAIVGFDSRGRRIELDPAAPPEQPTISIVPVETRFDKPMPLGSKNINDMNGNAIGTLVPVGLGTSSVMCADCAAEDQGGGGDGGGAGGVVGGSVPGGLYLEFSRILDRHESWVRGEPEIEVHIQGPTDQNNPRMGDDLSCSGESVYDSRKFFNQDDAFWTGRVMLFSADETARFQDKFTDGFHVMFWEDDDTACLLKLDNDVLIELLKASATTASVALKVVPIQWRVAASIFIAAFFSNPGEWLRTNDDFVGVAVPVEQTGYYYPQNTHVIMEGGTLNGRANIVYHP